MVNINTLLFIDIRRTRFYKIMFSMLSRIKRSPVFTLTDRVKRMKNSDKYNSKNYVEAPDNNVKKTCYDFQNQNGAKVKYNPILNGEILKKKFNLFQIVPNSIINPFSPAWHLRDAIQNAKETHIKDFRIERVNDANIYTTNDNIHLKNNNGIYSDGIPTITYYSLLSEALFICNNDKNNPLNFIKKIYSIYDGCDLGPRAKKDFEKISNIFYKLLYAYVKCWIVEMDDKKNPIRGLRNSSAHDNYFYLLNRDAWNSSSFTKLRKNLTPAQQQKLDQYYHQSDDWILWNLHSYSGKKSIGFCCIINNDRLWMAINKFRDVCKQIIKRSIENELKNDPAKKINDDNLAQLIEHIYPRDILNKFSS